MLSRNQKRIVRYLHSFFAPRSVQSVPEWCCAELEFDEERNRGPFKISGFEYLTEVLEWWKNPEFSDGVCVFATQLGKTSGIMGGVSHKAVNDPDRFLWVMPTRDLCSQFSRTRLQRMWRKSKGTRELIPSGAERHDFSTFHMRLGSSQIDMAWSGSPTALSSNPCGTVVLDEVDKFPPNKREADPLQLAEERTKSTAAPKRLKTSTPTIPDGPIWREFLKSDQRRWFVPCPHCKKHIVLVWSKEFTMMKQTGVESSVVWDKDAKRSDGSWDLDKVEASAHVECCHCGGHIRDGHKTEMNRGGEWRATAPAAKGYRGWHLPSLYSVMPECNFGVLARKFLQAKNSLEGLQNFINSSLAEPYMSQDNQAKRVELITAGLSVNTEGRQTILSVDVQSDCFWFTVLSFGPPVLNEKGELLVADCHTINAGQLDSWESVEAKQAEFQIPDLGVIVDSGDKTKRSGDSVYVQCAQHCQPINVKDSLPTLLGWTPAKGMPAKMHWKNKEGIELPYRVKYRDPYEGTSQSHLVTIGLFEFSGEVFKDRFDAMRRPGAKIRWSIAKEAASEDLWKHLDSNIKDSFLDKKRRRFVYGWRKKSEYWPDHILDATVQGLAYADYNGIIKLS